MEPGTWNNLTQVTPSQLATVDTGYCPSCGALVWEGGPPTAGEFPFACECDQIVTLRHLGYQLVDE